jgi:D12 class N6 adenine-specific DNA methyltransferase
MSVRIQYMGTKQSLAGDVRDLVADLRPQRPLLDLFCGMCSVAGAVSASGRSVWGNDIQRYAALAARCTIASPAGPPDAAMVAALLRDSVARNEDQLTERFAADLDRERAVLDEPTVDGYQAAYRRWRHAGNDPQLAAEAAALRRARGTVPYRLASIASLMTNVWTV